MLEPIERQGLPTRLWLEGATAWLTDRTTARSIDLQHGLRLDALGSDLMFTGLATRLFATS